MEYSPRTLKKYFDLVNKRGLITRDMWSCIQEYKPYYKELKELQTKRKEACKRQDEYDKRYLENEIKLHKVKFDDSVTLYLQDLCERIVNAKIQMETFSLKGKVVYTLKKDLDIFLLTGILNRDLRSCYKVQPADRMSILRPVKYLLEEKHSKIVLRLDIDAFFESIPMSNLLDKLQDDGILCIESLYLLRKIHEEYFCLSQKETGIPRGISCSSFLSEIYMRDIDIRIKELRGVYFYRRYVDDIILFASALEGRTAKSLYEEVAQIMGKYKLKLHAPEEQKKTKLIDTSKCSDFDFDYLGYHISVKDTHVSFTITQSNLEKYKGRIKEAVDTYFYQIHGKSHRTHLKPFSQLLTKIRLLTSNYRLTGSKSGIMTGIYFKYSLLTETYQLQELDDLLKAELEKITENTLPKSIGNFGKVTFTAKEYADRIRNRCGRYSFVQGYNMRKVIQIKSSDFRKLYKQIDNEA